MIIGSVENGPPVSVKRVPPAIDPSTGEIEVNELEKFRVAENARFPLACLIMIEYIPEKVGVKEHVIYVVVKIKIVHEIELKGAI